MRHARWILILVTTLLAMQAQATGMKIEPGSWEFQTTSIAPMSGGPKTTVATQCITEEEISLERFMTDAEGCTVTESESSDSMMRWKMTCSHGGGEMKGEAEFSSSGTEIRGVMKMAMDIGGQRMAFENKWEGRRIGPCD